MLVEAFVPHPANQQTLDEAVLHGLAGDVVLGHAVLLLPFEDGMRGQLGRIEPLVASSAIDNRQMKGSVVQVAGIRELATGRSLGGTGGGDGRKRIPSSVSSAEASG